MSDINPYVPSVLEKAKIPFATGQFPLAGRWHRLAGNVIDTILLLALTIVPYAALLIGYGFLIDPAYFESESLEPRNLTEFLVESVLVVVCLSCAFLILNGYLISTRGQTIGKYLLKTKMVGDDDELVSLSRIFFMRYLLFWIVTMIPLGRIIGLVDALMIFGDEHKCLHDRIAGTKVVTIADQYS